MPVEFSSGTATFSTWQIKLAQRAATLEPGTHLLVVNVLPGTVEPTWSLLGTGKMENSKL